MFHKHIFLFKNILTLHEFRFVMLKSFVSTAPMGPGTREEQDFKLLDF